jgi:putative flippase GtrA
MPKPIVVRLLAHLSRITYARYIVASAGALAVDMGIFMALLRADMPATSASVMGYVSGIGAHWLLSSRAVFTDASESGRNRQKLLFIASALVGLAITAAIVGAADMLGIDPRIAKLGAIGVAFNATYLLRKRIVFS